MVGVSRDTRTADEVLAEELYTFRGDPLGYCMFMFPWSSDPTIQLVKLAEGVPDRMSKEDFDRRQHYRERFPDCEYGPDLWACDFLDDLGAQIRSRKFDGRTPVAPIRTATVSGHEIGKSMLVGILTHFILDCYPLSKISITAVTDEQLRTKTWAEVGKWHHLAMTRHWFRYTASRGNMSMTHVDERWSGTWRADARTSRKEKSEAFAGQHAPTGVSAYIFDEASGIDDAVFTVREGGLTSGLPMVFDFGNGTRNSGAFFEECQGKERKRYTVRSIDSRTVAMTNKAKIEEDRQLWGEDKDRFKVRWRGLFPDKSSAQFIDATAVQMAGLRDVTPENYHPVVLGVDVARFGDDDSVIYPRVGRDARTFEPRIYHGLDTVQLTGRVIEYFQFFCSLGRRPAAIFVDDGGVGGGVVDQLNALGYPVIPVQFGGKPSNTKEYRFRSDEMWGRMRDGIETNGLCIPPRGTDVGDRLYDDLTQREYGVTVKDQINLESKPDMKKRGLSSPDLGDALALTYAQDVLSPQPGNDPDTGGETGHDYNPFKDI